MSKKTQQLQIRVTPEQKASLKRFARLSGLGLSGYVLSRALPSARTRFLELLRTIADNHQKRFGLAELNDLLSGLSSSKFKEAVVEAPIRDLSPYWQNYVAAMVEQAAHQKKIPPPAWTYEVEPLDAPRFAVPVSSLRLHLLRSAPVAFRRRNIFVDSGVGNRV